ncbi:MAG TPA: hypothetical protein VGJ72_09995 [Polaromonas sp.]
MALSQEIEMFGLTPLGILHTAISPIAVIAALIAFFRDKEILIKTMVGKVYVVTDADGLAGGGFRYCLRHRVAPARYSRPL